jgi:hypothetical protein
MHAEYDTKVWQLPHSKSPYRNLGANLPGTLSAGNACLGGRFAADNQIQAAGTA